MKKLLRSKANFGILEGFLSELLFTDVKIIEILESESNKETAKNKRNQVDIKVRDTDDQIILIEVQFSREQDYLHRILFETAKCIGEHLDEGKAYSEVSKVISVSILYFDFGSGEDYIYHGTTSFIGIHNQSELGLNAAQKQLFKVKTITEIFPEYYIINVSNFNNIATDTLDEWVYFLKNEEIKDNFKAKGLLEAKQKLDVLKLSKEERYVYDNYQKALHHQASLYQSTYVWGKQEGHEIGHEIGHKKGHKEGFEKGIAESDEKHRQQIVKSVKKMQKKGLSNEDIADFLAIDVQEVEQILQENPDG